MPSTCANVHMAMSINAHFYSAGGNQEVWTGFNEFWVMLEGRDLLQVSIVLGLSALTGDQFRGGR